MLMDLHISNDDCDVSGGAYKIRTPSESSITNTSISKLVIIIVICNWSPMVRSSHGIETKRKQKSEMENCTNTV